jgi:hypothetical protein
LQEKFYFKPFLRRGKIVLDIRTFISYTQYVGLRWFFEMTEASERAMEKLGGPEKTKA